MNILILNSILYTPQNGVISKASTIKGTMIYNLALAFKNAGHVVTLVAAKDYKPICDEEYPFKVLFFKSNLPAIFKPTMAPLHMQLMKYLWKERKSFDMIISSEVFSFNSLFASVIAGNKTIVWHELGQHYRLMHTIPSRIWYNVVARCLMRKPVTVPRSYRAEAFLSAFGLNLYNGFIDNGVNSFKLSPAKDKYEQMIVVSQLVLRKRVDTIIEKFAIFVSKYNRYNYKLYIAGDGPERSVLENRIKQLGMTDNIALLGNISHEELNKYLSHSVCMLCNTAQDLNMISISESIYCATPVLTNMVPYTSDLIKKENLGIAQDNWGEDEIEQMILNSSTYIENCASFSPNLTLDATIRKFIELQGNRQK